jgi:hypothetical protein
LARLSSSTVAKVSRDACRQARRVVRLQETRVSSHATILNPAKLQNAAVEVKVEKVVDATLAKEVHHTITPSRSGQVRKRLSIVHERIGLATKAIVVGHDIAVV